MGDEKQLGPVNEFQIHGPQSLFERLIMGGMRSNFLNVQYRMHEAILQIPNHLFYNNQILSELPDGQKSYKWRESNKFIDRNMPILIVNVKGKQTNQGTSLYNIKEAEVVKGLLE